MQMLESIPSYIALCIDVYRTDSPRHQMRCLVRAGGGLAGLELLEVPVADLHVAAVVVHALGEALRGAGAVVVLLLVLGGLLGLHLLGGGLGGAAGEEAADGVADGGANGDTAI